MEFNIRWSYVGYSHTRTIWSPPSLGLQCLGWKIRGNMSRILWFRKPKSRIIYDFFSFKNKVDLFLLIIIEGLVKSIKAISSNMTFFSHIWHNKKLYHVILISCFYTLEFDLLFCQFDLLGECVECDGYFCLEA